MSTHVEASAALEDVLYGDNRIDGPAVAHELLGRLSVIAPDAVLEAVDAARRAAAKPEGNVA